MNAITSLFLANWIPADWIEFNPAWDNGYGHFDFAVRGEHAPKVAVGDVVASITPKPSSRRILIIGHEKGNIVIFERYANGNTFGVSTATDIGICKDSNWITFEEMFSFFSNFDSSQVNLITGGQNYGSGYVEPYDLVCGDRIQVSLDIFNMGRTGSYVDMRVLQVKKVYGWEILAEVVNDGVKTFYLVVVNGRWIDCRWVPESSPYIALKQIVANGYPYIENSAIERLGFGVS